MVTTERVRRQRGRRGDRGTTAIEFAIVAPVLLLLLGSLAETGIFILIQTQLEFATERAARQIRVLNVGPATTDATKPDQKSLSQFKALVCTELSVPNCASRIRVDVQNDKSFARLQSKVPNPLESVGPSAPVKTYNETYDPGIPGDMGSLVVTYDWKFVFPIVGLIFGNMKTYPGIRRLAGLAIFRNEQ